MTLLNKIKNINYCILKLSDTIMTKALLFGDTSFSNSTKTPINSNIAFKTASILSARVEMILKHLAISYFTILPIQTKQ